MSVHFPTHIGVGVQLFLLRSGDAGGIRARPPSEVRTQEPLAEVLKPDLDVLFFAGKTVVLAEAMPPHGTIVAVRAALRYIRRAFGQLTAVVVDDDAGRSQMVVKLET